MTTGVRKFLLTIFIVGLAACGGNSGGGDDGDPGPNPNPNPGGTDDTADVTIEQLAGTWYGAFDDTENVRTFEFTVSGSTINNFKLGGTALTDLTGTITKATEAPRTFRFTVSSNGGEITRGAWVVDPTAKYLTYVDREFDFAVVQKGTPAALPTYSQTDVNRSYSGYRVTTSTDFTTLTSSRASGPCVATTPATTPPSSTCTLTLSGGVTRTLSSVQIDDPLGRFIGTYSDNPPSTPPQPVARLYLSPDKNFAAGWTCPTVAEPVNPFTCDFYALTAGSGS
jgi:hypothetical protein